MPGKGTIAVEEAVISPGSAWILQDHIDILSPGDHSNKALEAHKSRLMDIHGRRLQMMDEHGVEYMLLSLTSPGCQGIADVGKSEATARETNNWLAGEVGKNPARFGGLAALSMHNPRQAAEELERAVKTLGFFGGLVNDYQDADNFTVKKYFDTAEYEYFWQKVEELDVPIYFHPRYPPVHDLKPGNILGDRHHLVGAGVSFHLGLSMHIYAICSSGE